jgi:transcriptional regulator with XRE-family HTH domain
MSNNVFSELLAALIEEGGEVSQLLLAKTLKVSQSTVTAWLSGATPSQANIKKILTYFRDYNAASLISPVLEYKAIEPFKSRRSWIMSAAEDDKDLLHECMLHRLGVFIFYDSMGKAIYLGKSESCMYTEAKKRLADVSNSPLLAPNRSKPPYIGELARYVSVYEVSVPAAIKNLEAFLLRAFSNNLLNEEAGNFKGSLKRIG